MEDTNQISLFTFLSMVVEPRYPDAYWVYHTPLGGFRAKRTAVHMKRMGTKPGIPDILLPLIRGQYNGLAIEMKYGKNKPTVQQHRWLTHLATQRWLVYVENDWMVCASRIVGYLGGNPRQFSLTVPDDCVIITSE